MTIAHVLVVVTTVFTVVQFILVYNLCMYLVAYSPVFRHVVSSIVLYPLSVIVFSFLFIMCCFLSVSSLCLPVNLSAIGSPGGVGRGGGRISPVGPARMSFSHVDLFTRFFSPRAPDVQCRPSALYHPSRSLVMLRPP